MMFSLVRQFLLMVPLINPLIVGCPSSGHRRDHPYLKVMQCDCRHEWAFIIPGPAWDRDASRNRGGSRLGSHPTLSVGNIPMKLYAPFLLQPKC